MIKTLALLTGVLGIALTAAGCGEEVAADTAVEATEQNTVELGGVRYRVMLFRQMNVAEPPDDALWEGEPPDARHGLYLVSLRACATGDGARTSDEIQLEDAFGTVFEPRIEDTTEQFRYEPGPLAGDECVPAPNSPAEQTFDGAVLVFEIPLQARRDRPLVLQIGDPGSDRRARIELDL